MIIVPIAAGLLTILSVGALARGAGRRPLPVDIAGSVRSSLRTQNSQTIESMLAQLEPKYAAQAKVIRNAITIASDPHLTPDVRATYLQSVMTGQPERLKQAAEAFESKYHYLAARLRDLSDVMHNLTGVA